MKIIYLANLRLPTEKAYGIQIAKMCEAFNDAGHEVTLIYPERQNKIKDNIFDYYGLRDSFDCNRVGVLDFYWPGFLDKFAAVIKNYISAKKLVHEALKYKDADIFYTRDELVDYFLSCYKKNVIFESHRFSNKRKIFYSRFKKLNLKIVAISQELKDAFIRFGYKESNILVARDGVDAALFDINLSKEESRRTCNLPQDKKIIMYSGHLFEWKGADVLAEAAYNMPDSLFVFAGGTDRDIEKFKAKYESDNILILGRSPHSKVPSLLKAADVLVLPNRSKEIISEKYTSPLKLFEYMMSQRPIVASDLPSIREVLNDKNSILVGSDSPAELMRGIENVLSDSSLAERIAIQSYQDVKEYTWSRRAEKIIRFYAQDN